MGKLGNELPVPVPEEVPVPLAVPPVVALAEEVATAAEAAGPVDPAHLHAARASLVALATAGLISCTREQNNEGIEPLTEDTSI